MDVTVRRLRYFLAVADELHFARAADRLHITPPSLSQQIAALERQFHVALFRRTSRRVELTDQGRALVPLARRAVDALDEVITWAGPAGALSRVRIGVVAANHHTDAVLSRAVERFPDVSWEVHTIGFADAAGAVRDDRVDVVFALGPEVPTSHGMVFVPLWTEQRILVTATGHRFAGREGVALREMAGETFIGIRDAPGQGAWFDAPDFHPRVLPLASTFEEILQLCAAGAGVNIAGSGVAGAYARPGLSYVPITDARDVTTYLCRKATGAAGLVREFESIAVEVARDRS